jgi:hypothetical protein
MEWHDAFIEKIMGERWGLINDYFTNLYDFTWLCHLLFVY